MANSISWVLSKLRFPLSADLGGTGKTSMGAGAVGSVMQASGVPTGTVIERGSNANGEYTKYADGTLICSRRRPMTRVLQTAAGSALFSTSAGETQVDYPLAFVSVPTEVVTVVGETYNVWWTGFGTATNITSSAGFIISYVSRASSAYVVNYQWIGRWF